MQVIENHLNDLYVKGLNSLWKLINQIYMELRNWSMKSYNQPPWLKFEQNSSIINILLKAHLLCESSIYPIKFV